MTYLECAQPIVFWVDATFAGLRDFYPENNNLCQESIKNGNTMQLALDRCNLAIYASHWAAQIAIDNYKINPNKVKKELAISAFGEYQSRPNWSIAGKTVKQMLMDIV